MTEPRVMVTVENSVALRRSLKTVTDGLADLRALNLGVARIVTDAAESRSPRASGTLATAHRATATRTRARVVVATPYAAPIHWGWPARNISARNWASDAAAATESRWTDQYHDGIQALIDRAAEGCQ